MAESFEIRCSCGWVVKDVSEQGKRLLWDVLETVRPDMKKARVTGTIEELLCVVGACHEMKRGNRHSVQLKQLVSLDGPPPGPAVVAQRLLGAH